MSAKFWLSAPTPPKTYYEGASWKLEDLAGIIRDLREGDAFSIDRVTYRLHLPGTVAETPPAANPVCGRHLSQTELEILVAADEESAAFNATVAGERLAVQARSHLYLLAYLARQRLREGTGEDTGWVAVDEACRQLDLSPEFLSVMVFRCRKEFEQLSFIEATRIVDRAKRGLLRIGVAAERLSIRAIH